MGGLAVGGGGGRSRRGGGLPVDAVLRVRSLPGDGHGDPDGPDWGATRRQAAASRAGDKREIAMDVTQRSPGGATPRGMSDGAPSVSDMHGSAPVTTQHL